MSAGLLTNIQLNKIGISVKKEKKEKKLISVSLLFQFPPPPQKGADEPQEESGVNTFWGSSEVPHGTTEDMEMEEEDDEEGESEDSVLGSPVKPGILTRLARLV